MVHPYAVRNSDIFKITEKVNKGNGKFSGEVFIADFKWIYD